MTSYASNERFGKTEDGRVICRVREFVRRITVIGEGRKSIES
jgi:hypothetical protein